MSAYGFKSLQVFTTCDKEFIHKVAEKATELGLNHSGAVCLPLNDHWFLTVFPTGSKLGWPQVKEFDDDIYKLIDMCHQRNREQGDKYMHFVVLDSYEHESLGEWQHRIEIAV